MKNNVWKIIVCLVIIIVLLGFVYISSNVYEGIGYSVNKPPILDPPTQSTGQTGQTGPIPMPFTATIIPTGPVSISTSSNQENPTPTSNTQPPTINP